MAKGEAATAVFLREVSEDGFQHTIIDAAKYNGWRVFWIPDWIWKAVFVIWKKTGSRRGKRWAEAGFPDLVLRKPPRLIVAEVKSADGRVRDVQKGWLADLQACGIDARVWRPKDWDEIERVLTEFA